MTELDFMVPAQVLVGEQSTPLDVVVGPGKTAGTISLGLTEAGVRLAKPRLTDESVPATEDAVLRWLEVRGAEIGRKLDAEHARKKRWRGY